MTRRPVPTSSRLGLPTGDYSVELSFDGEFAASFSGVQVGDLPPAIVNSDTGGEFRLNPPASQAGELDAALPSRLFRFDVPAGARILRVVLTTTQGVASPHLRAGTPPVEEEPMRAPAASPTLVEVNAPEPGRWYLRVEGLELPALYIVRVEFE